MSKKTLFSISWLALGLFLFLVGTDIFLLIPEFRFENIIISTRSQLLYIYIIIASYSWYRGWRYGLQNRFTFPAFIYSSLQKIPSSLRWSLAVTLVLLPSFLLFFTPLAYEGIGIWLRALTILTAALGVSFLFIKPTATKTELLYTYVYSIMVVGTVFFAGGILMRVTSYPFSLTWSEGNRLWDFSIRFGSDRYIFPEGKNIFVFASAGKGLLWGLPYLIPGIDIFGVRLWNALYKILPHMFLGFLLVFDYNGIKSLRWERILFGIWAFLFLLQGPVQPTLIVSAIITVVGVRRKNLLLAGAIVAMGGFYANLSRWTWAYAPGLWAGMLALLSLSEITLKREDWGKLTRPVILGFAGYLGFQLIPQFIKIRRFGVYTDDIGFRVVSYGAQYSLSQELLWNRLLPNSTFPPGIIIALFIAVVPLFTWLLLVSKHSALKMSKLQAMGVSIPLVIFLGVGLVASTKIGGGGDLHNLDMFMVGMVIIAGYAWPTILRILRNSKLAIEISILGYLMLMMPIVYVLGFSATKLSRLPDSETTASSLAAIQSQVYLANASGEVLFMDQRQLLTFGYIEGIPLVDEYEKKLVMDRAFSRNYAYFETFYADLASHRFKLIVSEPIFVRQSIDNKGFPNENDIWVEWVSRHILKYYEVLESFPEIGVQLLIPLGSGNPFPVSE